MTVRAWLHSLFMTSVQFDDCESLATQFVHDLSSV